MKKALCRIFLKSEKLKSERGNKSVGLCFQKSQWCWEDQSYSVWLSVMNLSLSLLGEGAASLLPATATFRLSNVFKFIFIEVYKTLSTAWDGLWSCELSFACCSSYNVFSVLLLHCGCVNNFTTNELFRAVVICGLLHLPRKAEGFLELSDFFGNAAGSDSVRSLCPQHKCGCIQLQMVGRRNCSFCRMFLRLN